MNGALLFPRDIPSPGKLRQSRELSGISQTLESLVAQYLFKAIFFAFPTFFSGPETSFFSRINITLLHTLIQGIMAQKFCYGQWSNSLSNSLLRN